MRPVVSIDIDGTLGDYHTHLQHFIAGYWNRPDLEESLSYWNGEGNFEDYLGLTRVEYREAKLAFRQGGMKRTMPTYAGAGALVERVRSAGAEVWIATTRPWQRLDNVDPDTRFWLDKNEFAYEGLLYGEDKYGDLCATVDSDRIVAVIDDLPEQYDRAVELGLPVMQVARDHNTGSGVNRPNRGSLFECATWALDNIRKWTTT